MHPSQVLDMQMDLIQRIGNPLFRSLLVYSVGHQFGIKSGFSKEQVRQSSEAATDNMLQIIRSAPAYRVTEDMSLMVEHAAEQLEELDQFHDMFAPTRTGFARFDRPLHFVDVRGNIMKAHWMIWGPTYTQAGPATAIWLFNDSIDPDPYTANSVEELKVSRPKGLDVDSEASDEQLEKILMARGRWSYIGMGVAYNAERLGPQQIPVSDEQREQLEEQGVQATPGTSIPRAVHAFWTLMGQTLTHVDSEDDQVGRPTKRRARRMEIPGKISVVHLRRTEGSRQEGESLVEWAHRWPVRGHWRWQPYGPRKIAHAGDHEFGPPIIEGRVMIRHCVHFGCEKRIERIFIAPYVKGPDDAPLVITSKVYSLDR